MLQTSLATFPLIFLILSDLLKSTISQYIYIYIRGSLSKFPDFFFMGTFIDSTRMEL